MTEPETLVLERVAARFAREIDELRESFHSRTRLTDCQAAIRVEITALGQQVAVLTTAVYSGQTRCGASRGESEKHREGLDLTG